MDPTRTSIFDQLILEVLHVVAGNGFRLGPLFLQDVRKPEAVSHCEEEEQEDDLSPGDDFQTRFPVTGRRGSLADGGAGGTGAGGSGRAVDEPGRRAHMGRCPVRSPGPLRRRRLRKQIAHGPPDPPQSPLPAARAAGAVRGAVRRRRHAAGRADRLQPLRAAAGAGQDRAGRRFRGTHPGRADRAAGGRRPDPLPDHPGRPGFRRGPGPLRTSPTTAGWRRIFWVEPPELAPADRPPDRILVVHDPPHGQGSRAAAWAS